MELTRKFPNLNSSVMKYPFQNLIMIIVCDKNITQNVTNNHYSRSLDMTKYLIIHKWWRCARSVPFCTNCVYLRRWRAHNEFNILESIIAKDCFAVCSIMYLLDNWHHLVEAIGLETHSPFHFITVCLSPPLLAPESVNDPGRRWSHYLEQWQFCCLNYSNQR